MAGVGVFLSISAAFFKATKSILNKYAVELVNEFTVSWAIRFVSVFIFAVFLLSFRNVYVPSSNVFWWALLVNSIGLSMTTILISKAFQKSDISVISPILGLVPIAVVFPAIILLQETPSRLSGIGIVLVSIGIYLLHYDKTTSIFKPVLRLRDDTGVQLVVIALAIISILPSIDKIGIQNSSPIIWVFSTHIVTALILFIVALYFDEQFSNSVERNWKLLCVLGTASAMIWIVQAYAYTMLNVSYVQAIKRGSILISILVGGLIFNEQNYCERLVGGGIIFCGIVLVVIGI